MEIITLNMVPKGITPVCHASQFDDGRVIRLNIVDELQGYIFTDEEVELRVRKPDDNVVTASVAVVSGNAYVDIVTTEQMTACEGDNECELRLTRGEQRIGSLNFKMRVEKDPLKDGIESETEIHNLETQIHDMNEAMLPGMVAEEVTRQYDSENVIFDDVPTENHGDGYTVNSAGLKSYIPKAIDELDDVEINNPQANQAIVYNPTTQKFENGEVSTVGGLNDLNDVTLENVTNKQELVYDDTDDVFKNKTTRVELTQAEYDQLVADDEVLPDVDYYITDAPSMQGTSADLSYDGDTDSVYDVVEEVKGDVADLSAITTPVYLSTITTGANISFSSNTSYRVGNLVVLNCILKVTGNLANNATILSNIPKNGANAPIRFLRVVGSDVYYGHDDNSGGFNIDANATSVSIFGALSASSSSPKYLFVNLTYICSLA